MGGGPLWLLTGFFLDLLAAICCLLVAVWLMRRIDGNRRERPAMVGALIVSCAWCVGNAAFGPGAHLSSFIETMRDLAWLFVLYRLFANDGRDQSLAPIRPLVVVLVAVECLQPLLLVLDIRLAGDAAVADVILAVSALLRVLVAVGALVLLHNLYAGASAAFRLELRWTAAGLGILWAYQLNLYAVTYFTGASSSELLALRGLFIALSTALFALGANSRAADLKLLPSRAVAFQSLSLLVIGAYLLVMLVVSQSLSLLGGGLARLTQVGFVFAAAAVAVSWLPSRRLRGWLRVNVFKHLFQHRYDYRAEWLRFTETIGRAGPGARALAERAAQALADITDSDGAALLLPDNEGSLGLAGTWNWVGFAPPAIALGPEFVASAERTGAIIELDDAAFTANTYDEQTIIPQWLQDDPKAWIVVPLLHFKRLVGVAILTRPPVARKLDWEDFDLLKVVGGQLASYIAEQAGHEALAEATRFDEFNRRIAFVMHDIKNLASQLSLLARNAEKHADNPDFRADMLVTLTKSADKLNALLARLGRYGTGGAVKREPVDLSAMVRAIARRFDGIHPVQFTRKGSCTVVADPEALEQALVHLVQNAVDASDHRIPVTIDVTSDGLNGRVEVLDSGAGMSPQFIRESLFKPFVSSKNGGFGIGAYEARELVRAMGGRLDVESREGLGTRFTLTLPLAAAVELSPAQTINQEVA